MLHQPKISTPRWTEMVERNLCVHWKQRRELNEQREGLDGKQLSQDTAAEDIQKPYVQEHEKNEEQRRVTEKKYTNIALDSHNRTLLLPSISIPSEKQSVSYVATDFSNIEQQRLLQEARNDRDKAMI